MFSRCKKSQTQGQRERRPMKGVEPIIQCDRMGPLRLNPQRRRRQKVQKVAYQGRGAEESNTINSFLVKSFSPAKMISFMFYCDSLLLDD